MSEFTKGPWTPKESKNKLYLDAIRRDPGCFAACMQHHYTLYGPATDQSEFVADITTDTRDEGFANAHLIAAAPDMYEALEECVESLVRYKSCLHGYAKESAHDGKRDNQEFWTTRVKGVQDLQDEVAKALAKAKGESE